MSDRNSLVPPTRTPETPATANGPHATLPQTPADSAEASALSSSRWQNLPGYQILRELGRGGMGVVYEAREVELDRVVALKMVMAGALASPEALRRFQNEAKSVAALEHPHIVRIYQFGEHFGSPYFAMEYCPDGTLEKLATEAPLTAAAAAGIVEQLARAVAHAHERGLIHRDLKPQNVLMAKGGMPKITDFGLVKILGSDASLSNTGDVMGTPPYMSPEQASGERDVGPATDIWALGATLYRLLGGRPPFLGARPIDTIQQVICNEPVALRQLNRSVPRDLETICHKCLQKDVRRRYASAADLADDLRRFRVNEPILARPVGRIERAVMWCRRHKAAAALLATVVLTTLVVTPAMTLLRLRAERARERANSEQLKKESALQAELDAHLAADLSSLLFIDLTKVEDPTAFLGSPPWVVAEKRTVGDVIGKLSKELSEQDNQMPSKVRAKLHATLSQSLRNLGRLQEAKAHFATAQRLRVEEPSTRPKDLIQTKTDLAQLDFDLGEFDKAHDRFKEIGDQQAESWFDPADVSLTRWRQAMSLLYLGDVDALQALEDVRDARKAATPSNPLLVLRANLAIAEYFVNHAMFHKATEKYVDLNRDIDVLPDGQAKTIAKAALRLMATLTIFRPSDDMSGFGKKVTLNLVNKGFQECVKECRATLPPYNSFLFSARLYLAETLDLLGQNEAAGAEYRDLLRDIRNSSGVADPRTFAVAINYGNYLVRTDKQNGLRLARELFDEITAANLNRFGPINRWRSRLLLARSEFESENGDDDRAEKFAREALTEIAAGRFHRTREMSQAIVDAGLALLRRSRGALAADLFHAGRDLVKATHGPAALQFCSVAIHEGRARLMAGDISAARACLAEAEKLAESLSPPLTKYLRRHLARLKANLHLSLGKSSEAEAEFRQVLANSRELPPEDFDLRQEDADAVAGALADQAKFKEALQM